MASKLGSITKKAKYFIRIDLNDAFLQTEIRECDRHKTAFCIPGVGEYEFIKMAFGLTNAPATQSKLMMCLFGHIPESKLIFYYDDIVVMGETFEELMENTELIANILSQNNMMIRTHTLSNALKKIVGKLMPSWEVAKIVAKKESYGYEAMKSDGKIVKISVKDIKRIDKGLQNRIRREYVNLNELKDMQILTKFGGDLLDESIVIVQDETDVREREKPSDDAVIYIGDSDSENDLNEEIDELSKIVS
jgi:hypothetical protein